MLWRMKLLSLKLSAMEITQLRLVRTNTFGQVVTELKENNFADFTYKLKNWTTVSGGNKGITLYYTSTDLIEDEFRGRGRELIIVVNIGKTVKVRNKENVIL